MRQIFFFICGLLLGDIICTIWEDWRDKREK